MRAWKPASVLVVVGFGLVSVTAPAAAQTLSEVLATAYQTNPTLQAARAGLRAVNEGVPQALSNWRPQVTVSSTLGKQYTEQESSFLTTEEGTTPLTARLDVVQPLYRGGRTVAATRAAENDVLGERARLSSVEQSVLLDAATAFMDVWRDQAVLKLTINNEKVIERQLEATRDRFSVGEVTRTDVAQAETRLAVAQADRIAAEGNLTGSIAVYEEVVGASPQDLRPPLRVENLPRSREEAVALAIQANPDILAASFAEKAARSRVREAIGELLPTVSLKASALRNEETSQKDSLTRQAQILAEVSIPIFQQGLVTSRVRQAKQISSQRRVEIETRRRQVEQEAISAWEALQTARAQIRSFEAGVRSAEIALEGVRQENLVGARTILDILDAEQELLDARVNLVRAQRDEIVASFRVLAAIGRLTARDLNLEVVLYDPDSDYRKVRNRWLGLSAPGADE